MIVQPSIEAFTEISRLQEERDRLDIFHKLISVARRGRHCDRDLPERAKVLDLGTGTGIWAIDVSE